MNFTKERGPLEGGMVISPRIFSDDRGYFLETYVKRDFEAMGIFEEFVQDNQSSSRKGVIRGLHYQGRYPQGKLVRVLAGSIYDVMVDLRQGSPSFAKYHGLVLSERDHRMIYVPAGFAHGFLSLENNTEVQYKTTEYYHPEYDAGIIWNDPDIGISWPLREHGIDRPVLSDKDANLPLLVEINSPFEFRGR